MDSFGLNLGFLLAQIVNLTLLVLWLGLLVSALWQLPRRNLTPSERLLWLALLLLLPYLGALVFWMVQPGKRSTES